MRTLAGAMWKVTGAAGIALVLVAAPGVVFGQQPEVGDLHDSEVYGWVAPSPAAQIAEDATMIPSNKGAIFVPYISNPADEPEYVVFREHTRVGSGSPGTRVVVAPGRYRVELGSGHTREVVSDIEVTARETTVVPVTWGALRVEVVDQRGIPHRAGYEVIRVADRDLFGVGYGADLLAGERLPTWVLAPDLYRIVQPGSSYRARVNYATVYVPSGGFVRYRLVIDRGSGEFLGAGVVTPDETGTASGDERVVPNLVLGVNGNLSIDRDVVGTAELFVDGGVTFRDEPHHFLTLFQLEEGITWIDPEVGDALPIQKSDDRLRIDLLYSYDITQIVGPYVRAGVETSMFPATVITTEQVGLTRYFEDGSSEFSLIGAGSAFRTAEAFGQALFFEGTGINAWLARGGRGQVKASAGLGFRQGIHHDLFAETDRSSTPNLVYAEVENFYHEGVEALLLARARVGEFGRLTTNFELFTDFSDFGNPTLDWENTVSIKLLEVLSLDYVLEITREPVLYDDVRLAHEILLRFAWEII